MFLPPWWERGAAMVEIRLRPVGAAFSQRKAAFIERFFEKSAA
jgi:hypothetical protein